MDQTLGSGKKPCCKSCGEGGPCTGCGSKVHPCPCETGQMVGAGSNLPFRPMIGAQKTLGATTSFQGSQIGMVAGGIAGTLGGYYLAKRQRAGIGWQLLAAGLGAVLGTQLGTAAGSAITGS